MMRRAFLVVLGVATVLGLARTARADDVAIVDGTFGPGALYRLAKPAAWNGALVVYAHGFVSPGQPVGFPLDVEQAILGFTSQGYAVAASSFSDNGWVVKDGTQRTHQLLGIFTSKFGAPTRLYAAGGSMGGLIAIRLIETYPNEFAGLYAVCPVSGGLRRELDYVANVRVLFDLFYPGVLPGSAVDVPPGLDVATQIVAPALAAMAGDPTGAFAIASIVQTPVPYASLPELFQSIVTALGAAAGYRDLLALTHGQPFFDNTDTQYTGALPAPTLAWINANVERFAASPAGLNFVEHNYTPTGELHVPALTLTTYRDPLVPAFNGIAYGATVAAAGNADWLVQRSVAGTDNGYGHCTFTPLELVTAFQDLVLWAEYGIKPAP